MAGVPTADRRFTRTSALADQHVTVRAGTDIAFLGGVINYILANNLEFREYVQAYTNAPFLVNEQYQDTEDLDGLFSGYDPHAAAYDRSSWSYESVLAESASGTRHKEQSSPYQSGSGGPVLEGAAGELASDPPLEHPRCVFQILKRHFARYTPEMVERICGVPRDLFLKVCRAWTENSGRERTAALVYSVGWTQHSVGPQYIRAGAIIQLLLGNIGRPGGGVDALRGHASIQGSTDIPTLFNLLPGYLPMPDTTHEDLPGYLGEVRGHNNKGFWSNADTYMISLLKEYWRNAATPDRLPADRPAARPGNRGVHDRPRAPSAPVVGVPHARRGGPRRVRSPAQPSGRGRGRPGPAGRQRVEALRHLRGRRRVHQRPEIRGGAAA